MDYLSYIYKYYPEDDDLRRLLLKHSRQVADRCMKIAKKHRELPIDVQFLEEAAMLHDIGIFRCQAPSIFCNGTEPYICHGQIGGKLLRAEGFPTIRPNFQLKSMIRVQLTTGMKNATTDGRVNSSILMVLRISACRSTLTLLMPS